MTRPPLTVPLIAALMLVPTIALAQNPPPDPCGASGFQGLVGQTADIAEQLVLYQPKRVIFPDTMVTRDYRVDRINFDIDDAGQITRIYCG